MAYVFSSESVTEGHPDKVADRVSDAILDAFFSKDPKARVACETLVAKEFMTVAGEITAAPGVKEGIDAEAIARQALRDIGYLTEADGIGCDSAVFESHLTEQSSHIAQGTAARADGKIGAGDQGMMFGYAQTNDDAMHLGHADDYMPVPISLAHRLAKRLSEVRKDGTLGYLRPDGKSQVSVRYDDDGTPIAVDAIVLAAQHEPDVSQETIQADLHEHVVNKIVPAEWLHEDTQFYINHTGLFEIGGPAADAGLTGRKIIVDTYGGWIPHGGGAFSGKDPTKVDRSAAYYARYVAKNLVAAGAARHLQIQVAYSIGSLQPVSINVQTFGTGNIPDHKIEALVREDFDFAPGALIDELDLRRPMYTPTTAYGHMGRTDLDLPWEKLDRVESLTEKIQALA